MSFRPVIFIVGPTAAGKSEYAVKTALNTGGEIVSADSMQVYRGLDLGTAKPSVQERMGVIHHMIDIADPKQDYSAGAYSKEATLVIENILSRGKTPIVCGGSGLYVHSLLYDMDFSGIMRDDSLRQRFENEAEKLGPERLYMKLLEKDPSAASRVHPNNVKRVIRALERVYGEIESGGIRGFENTLSAPRRWDSRIIRLTADREELYRRINNRAEGFFEKGLVGEVRALLEDGVPGDSTAMQGIGYKEVVAFLEGQYDEEEALRLVKQNTRRFAKRQETWFKRYTDAEIINTGNVLTTKQ